MGSYTSFEDEDITIKDEKGLLNFIELWKKKYPESEYLCEGDHKEGLISYHDGKMYFSFQYWDGFKIISYWYCPMVVFLKLISKYIEGYVTFMFETHDEKATINFNDGNTMIEFGTMQYEQCDDILSLNKKKEYDEFADILLVEKL